MQTTEQIRGAVEAVWEVLEQEPIRIPPVSCTRCGRTISDFPTESYDPGERQLCVDCSREEISSFERPFSVGKISRPGLQEPDRFRQFIKAIQSIAVELRRLTTAAEPSVQNRFLGTEVWQHVIELEKFIDLSEEHGEIIATLRRVACSEASEDFPHSKASKLLEAFQLIGATCVPPEDLLEQFYTLLENGGFELNYPMKFMWDSPDLFA